ncbi:hypothetical protein ACFQ3S_10950 [Mucilaginibacter terrae]|uniref:hypothetical protein n=1 Tax=Mucilaginibacter terrae TaxID=1955052 RepID=UPI0036407012
MNYQEKFDVNKGNSSYFSNQFDILITGLREDNDARHVHFRNSIPNFKGKIYSFDTCDNADKFHYEIASSDNIIIDKADNKSLIPDLQTLLRNQNFQGANICIDITTLKQGILFLLIQLLLNEVKPCHLFAAYTEPIEYKKRDIDEIGTTEEYDLYSKVIGSSRSVPGFNKHRSSKEILLVASMGFDSQRLQTIYENLKPKKLIPIVGFPSFVPGWNQTAIKMNYMVLKGAECFDDVRPCEAASPFEMIELLNSIYQRHVHEFDVYISPLGTRPHCLGAAIFSSRNSNTYLIYDFPVEKKYRSESVLRSNIYYLSKYIS